MSHFVAYILQFQEIIVYKIPPGGGGGSIASLRSNRFRINVPFLVIHNKSTISETITFVIVGLSSCLFLHKYLRLCQFSLVSS